MAARVQRPLKIIAFNANDIWRRRRELIKQLQDLHIAVVLLSDVRYVHLTKAMPIHKSQTHPLMREDDS
jgi:hypothetical protein